MRFFTTGCIKIVVFQTVVVLTQRAQSVSQRTQRISFADLRILCVKNFGAQKPHFYHISSMHKAIQIVALQENSFNTKDTKCITKGTKHSFADFAITGKYLRSSLQSASSACKKQAEKLAWRLCLPDV
ncbi:MAG: hypothetical protein LBR26_12415 [Prevotella sp.]|jgi:hypothetical protein|nr:hypothetical protein [Prevotella sp.]